MAAPTPAGRVRPTDPAMREGYRSLVVFGNATNLALHEKTVTFSGEDNGEPVDCTTMLNGTWTTPRPRQLNTKTPLSFRAAYAGAQLDRITSQRGVEQSFTQHFPSGRFCCFWGYMQKFEPQENSIGNQPEALVTIIVTNYDPTNGVEADPVYGTNLTPLS